MASKPQKKPGTQKTAKSEPALDAIPSTIAAKLRNLIASGAYAPGVRLGQTELAEKFQASRVPVREALKLLSAEGVVDHDPNRGFFVSRFSSDEAQQLFRLRDLIENELLGTIEWPDRATLKEIESQAVRLEKLLNEGNRAEWWNRHREFHMIILNLSPRKIYVREAIRLWGLTDRYRILAPLPRRPSEERDIVNKSATVRALAERDVEKLIQARAHRRNAFRDLILEILGDRGL